MKISGSLEHILSPSLRFWTGISLIPACFLIDSLPAKLGIMAVFAMLTILWGKRIPYVHCLVMIPSIAFFHILNPVGRILLEIGPVVITAGSLETGIAKGTTLTSLVFLSLFSVSRTLRLPGRLGGLLGGVFYYYEKILEKKKHISPGHFMGSLDIVLMDLFPPDSSGELDFQNDVHKGMFSSFTVYSKVRGLLYVITLEFLLWGMVLWEKLMVN